MCIPLLYCRVKQTYQKRKRSKNMVSFSSFMLVMVLFNLLTIKDTMAHSDDQVKQMVHEAENDNARALRSHLSVEKEVLDGVPAASEFSNGKMGGRKMMIERKKNMKQIEEADSSGNSNSPSNPSPRNSQNQGDESKKSMNSASGRNSSKLVSTDDQSDDNESFQKLEPEKLVDDAAEFFTMMNKDYVGGPGSGSRPHHKPPINNFQPSHTSNP